MADQNSKARWFRHVSVTLVFLALAHGESANATEFEVSRQEIRDGTPSELDAVVGIDITSAQGARNMCTGSLIAPNLVVTAQHCVAHADRAGCNGSFRNRRDPSELSVTTAADISSAESFYAVRSIHTAAPLTCGGDLALLILDSNIPASEASPLVPELRDFPREGDEYVSVGYGLDAPDGQFGVRLESAGEVLCAGSGCASFSIHSSEWLSSAYDTCVGDSGGPAIAHGGRLIGLVSRGSTPCGGSTYTGMTAHARLIRQTAELAAEQGDYPAPAWSGTFWNGSYDPDDADYDGVSDATDNCPELSNAQQLDSDEDGIGDACSTDIDDKADRFDAAQTDSFEVGCTSVSAAPWWTSIMVVALFLTRRRRVSKMCE